MNAEKQHRKSQQADPIQSKRERSKLSFVDNRFQTVNQFELFKSIQKKENMTNLPDNIKKDIGNLSSYTTDNIVVIQRVNINGVDITSSTDLNDIKRTLGWKNQFIPVTVKLTKQMIQELLGELNKIEEIKGDLEIIYDELECQLEEEEEEEEEKVKEEEEESPEDFPYADFPSTSGQYTLIGVHETYQSNIQSLLDTGPSKEKVGTGHGLGKGEGFYITPVGRRKLSNVIPEELRYGTHFLAVYIETSKLYMINKAAPLEWVIPVEAFSFVRLARKIEDVSF